MQTQIIYGILIPFISTTAGAACVFFLRRQPHFLVQRSLTGFAAGVMTAASVWSLLIPAMEQSEGLGRLGFVPAAAGFLLGILFLLFLDCVIPHQHMNSDAPEGSRSSLSKNTMLLLAVTLHNIPEGMAVGVVYAGLASGGGQHCRRLRAGALPRHCYPELPRGRHNLPAAALLRNGEGQGVPAGNLSGAVEPLAAVLTVLLSGLVVPVLPYLLSFAAGAMVYVVVEELIPEMSGEPHSNVGTIAFAAGFVVMMSLDTALG